MKAVNAVPIMVTCALTTLASIDGAVLPKFPSLKITVAMTMNDTINTAADANSGWQRAATQSATGNSNTTTTHISHQSGGTDDDGRQSEQRVRDHDQHITSGEAIHANAVPSGALITKAHTLAVRLTCKDSRMIARRSTSNLTIKLKGDLEGGGLKDCL